MKNKNSSGPRIEPCGTPLVTSFRVELQSSILTHCSLLLRYEAEYHEVQCRMPWQNPSIELQFLVHLVDHSIRIFGQEIEEVELWRIYAFEIHVDFHVICISL